jgi:hypothetical protein
MHKKIKIQHDITPLKIYRGGEYVGDFPFDVWNYIVEGICSGVALTERGAIVMAQHHAEDRSRIPMTFEEATREAEAYYTLLDSLMEAYPYTEEEAKAVSETNARYGVTRESQINRYVKACT